MKRALAIVVLAIVASSDVQAQARSEFQVSRTPVRPTIDAVLDDVAWEAGPLPLGDWRSYNPLSGDTMSNELRTEVRIAYDDRSIYFAFRCVDNEPDKIRTNVSRRDTAFSDDWIALSLDSAGTGQTSYHLFVNPSGSQMDALNTSASGEQFDADLVWYSAGRVTSDGYIVEVEIPLQTLRFSSGDEVGMGILFFRKISRMGFSYSWPGIPAGQWVFDNHAQLRFSNLTQPRLVEMLPSVTYGVSQTRAAVEGWNPADGNANLGMSGKFGVTSNITLDGTINPDFSQVESDAFQVEVNQRFPVFYSEKRPFFMEGMGLFNVAGTGGDSNMRTSVHTRRVVDPFWGAKAIGTAGRTTFGVLNALDEGPEHDTLFTIARATYALRGPDNVGVIVTDTEQSGRHNRVIGGDLSIKFSPPQQLIATFLASETDADSAGGLRGTASHVAYGYETRRFSSTNRVEHYGTAFQMDTAFYNRAGFTKVTSTSEVNFYPGESGNFWLQRVHPFYLAWRGHDEIHDGSEAHLITGIRFNFTRQGYFEIMRSEGHEPWLGRRFKTGRDVSFYGAVQILRWLRVNADGAVLDDIYYDPVDPFQGRSRNVGVGVVFQPNQHFTQEVDARVVRFDRASSGERVFSVNILNFKTGYQFDKHFLVRLIEQYDSATRRLLTDLLASYEFLPGTVFHAGYGSLHEDRQARNRGLFFKASYLHRF
jgi:hypothetical protein